MDGFNLANTKRTIIHIVDMFPFKRERDTQKRGKDRERITRKIGR